MLYRINFYEKSTLLKVQLVEILSISDIELCCANLFCNGTAKEEIFIEAKQMYFNGIGKCTCKMKNGKFAFYKSAKVKRDFYNINNHSFIVIKHIVLE